MLDVIKEAIKRMQARRQEEQLIVPFPDGPTIVNAPLAGSATPTIQTTATNKQVGTIPGRKYSGMINYQRTKHHQ